MRESDLRCRRVLVVDDDRIFWQMYSAAFKEPQWLLDCHNYGEDAISAVKSNTYDLIFFDLSLPQKEPVKAFPLMDDLRWGAHVFTELRANHRGPIIVVAGHTTTLPGKEFVARIGAELVLAKEGLTVATLFDSAQRILLESSS